MAVGLRPIRRPQASSYFGQFRRARPKHLCLNKPCGIGQRCRRHAAVRLLVSDPPLPRQREGHILLQRKLSPEMLDRATAMDQAMTAARAAEHWSPKGRSSTKAERFPLPLCSRGQGRATPRGYPRGPPTRTSDGPPKAPRSLVSRAIFCASVTAPGIECLRRQAPFADALPRVAQFLDGAAVYPVARAGSLPTTAKAQGHMAKSLIWVRSCDQQSG